MKAYKSLCKQLGYQFLDKSTDYKNKPPIFIHSLWRSGSTYFFKLFRESRQGYYTYQESIHEIILSANTMPHILLDVTSSHLSPVLRHPILGKPYFYELYKTHHLWSPFVSKSMILDSYFSQTLDKAMVNYFEALIKGATGRAVFQECRTSNRIGAIKKHLGGIHIYLWRNPWDQWWSFKVSEYFDAVCQIILGASSGHSIINFLKEEIGYCEFHNNDITLEIDYFFSHKLSSKDSYLVYYTLWCLAFSEANSHADLMINIDQLSGSINYRNTIVSHLNNLGIYGLDFSDCKIPQAFFDEVDKDFFYGIEEHAHTLLVKGGWSWGTIEMIKLNRKKHKINQEYNNIKDILFRDIRKTRDIILRN